jgi:hypothetical protein
MAREARNVASVRTVVPVTWTVTSALYDTRGAEGAAGDGAAVYKARYRARAAAVSTTGSRRHRVFVDRT